MRKKKVWRYYCDFCKKSGCAAGHMKKHETRCTANPNRKCGICRLMGNVQQETDRLVSILKEQIPVEEQMQKLRDATDNCPACILAAIRQAGLQGWDISEDGIECPNYNFYFKKELKAFFDAYNAEAYEQERSRGYY